MRKAILSGSASYSRATLIVQVPTAQPASSRDERQANSSNASGLKQANSLGAAQNGSADPKPASSSVKFEAHTDGISSQSAHIKQTDANKPVKVEIVSNPQLGQASAGDDAVPVEVKLGADSTKSDARPESGEISIAASEAGQKGEDSAMQNGPGLTIKVKVGATEDEAVGSSPVARPQEFRPRERYPICKALWTPPH